MKACPEAEVGLNRWAESCSRPEGPWKHSHALAWVIFFIEDCPERAIGHVMDLAPVAAEHKIEALSFGPFPFLVRSNWRPSGRKQPNASSIFTASEQL
jgi:hypothetical protein